MPEMPSARSDPSLIDLYEALLRVRMAEQLLAKHYKDQEMRTPTHFGLGQEAVAVGVCAALAREDVVYSHHRCHNHYLAKGGSIEGLAAELYGRESGCSRGRGGSVHLTAREVNVIATSAILGQTVAVAAGSALAFKMRGEKRVAVSFFGDATCEEGAFYESLNYAAIHKLPVLFICENNLYSTESPLAVRQPAGTDLCQRVETFQVTAQRVDGNDVGAVYAATHEAVERLRAGQGPYFIECMTYRWLEHVGPSFDHDLNRNYRSKAELDRWMENCPVKRCAAELIRRGAATAEALADLDNKVAVETENTIQAARLAPWPVTADLFRDVW
jgi:pyruvate dehydrogenase E1 component alpha subunit